MAWHILHGLLEQVRLQSTFPGKLWIITMFIFRIVVVARIGDNVYHDEQSSFVCNTLTPGCENVCFNRFSPISQLRYWSLMVLVVSTPSILFFLYAMHKIYHAGIKYPAGEKTHTNMTSSLTSQQPHTNSENSYLHPPSYKRRRENDLNVANGHVHAPLYEVTKIPDSGGRFQNSKLGKFLRKRRRHNAYTENNVDVISPVKCSVSDNNEIFMEQDMNVNYRQNRYPIYVDAHGRRVEFIKQTRRTTQEQAAMDERKFKAEMLQHTELSRAYWWHVFVRTLCEVGFILGQYYLYGISVPELFECPFWPCPKTVDCFVSRPQEKTCLLWLMYGLGGIACLFSLAEFWTLGLDRAKTAFLCCSDRETREERKRRLAMLDIQSKPSHPRRNLRAVVSMDSISSDTTVESV
uniref:gap junction gamma-1 protein-like n=1 Tax=Styela clava TaxID=7725 RepID=UPI001939FD7F|nr:gap junction gamma-1 protein-like [Styela clava]